MDRVEGWGGWMREGGCGRNMRREDGEGRGEDDEEDCGGGLRMDDEGGGMMRRKHGHRLLSYEWR